MTAFPAADSRYPLLALIDSARSAADRPFSTGLQAAKLELRARELAADYWPEQVWLTGSISTPLLDAVAQRLETEREALHERINVVVVTEQRSIPHA